MIRVYESREYIPPQFGEPLTEDMLTSAFGVITQNYGTPTHMIISERALKSFTRIVKKGNSLKSKHK